MAEKSKQQRQENDPRFKFRLAVHYGREPQRLMADYAVNMSTGGLYLETVNVLPVGTPLVVKFKLPGNDAVIVGTSRVAWTIELGSIRKPSLPPGMGLQFIDFSSENIRTMREFFGKSDLVPVA